MQLQPPVACHLEDAQHLHRLVLEAPAGRAQQLALRQHEPLLEQRRVGLPGQRGRPECGADHRRLQHRGDPGRFARGQEVVAHEPLHPVLPAMPRVAHAGADHRLQVEGQALLGAAGDVVQVEAHRPQEVPGPPGVARLVRGQDAAAGASGPTSSPIDLGAEHVAAHPVERLQVAQPALALLDVGLHQERALAVAVVAQRTLRLLGRDERGRTRSRRRMQRSAPGTARTRARSPVSRRASISAVRTVTSCPASAMHSSTVRVAWPTFRPRSHMKYSMNSTARRTAGAGSSGARNSRSMSLNGASRPRP